MYYLINSLKQKKNSFKAGLIFGIFCVLLMCCQQNSSKDIVEQNNKQSLRNKNYNIQHIQSSKNTSFNLFKNLALYSLCFIGNLSKGHYFTLTDDYSVYNNKNTYDEGKLLVDTPYGRYMGGVALDEELLISKYDFNGNKNNSVLLSYDKLNIIDLLYDDEISNLMLLATFEENSKKNIFIGSLDFDELNLINRKALNPILEEQPIGMEYIGNDQVLIVGNRNNSNIPYATFSIFDISTQNIVQNKYLVLENIYLTSFTSDKNDLVTFFGFSIINNIKETLIGSTDLNFKEVNIYTLNPEYIQIKSSFSSKDGYTLGCGYRTNPENGFIEKVIIKNIADKIILKAIEASGDGICETITADDTNNIYTGGTVSFNGSNEQASLIKFDANLENIKFAQIKENGNISSNGIKNIKISQNNNLVGTGYIDKESNNNSNILIFELPKDRSWGECDFEDYEGFTLKDITNQYNISKNILRSGNTNIYYSYDLHGMQVAYHYLAPKYICLASPTLPPTVFPTIEPTINPTFFHDRNNDNTYQYINFFSFENKKFVIIGFSTIGSLLCFVLITCPFVYHNLKKKYGYIEKPNVGNKNVKNALLANIKNSDIKTNNASNLDKNDIDNDDIGIGIDNNLNNNIKILKNDDEYEKEEEEEEDDDDDDDEKGNEDDQKQIQTEIGINNNKRKLEEERILIQYSFENNTNELETEQQMSRSVDSTISQSGVLIPSPINNGNENKNDLKVIIVDNNNEEDK